MKFLLKAPFLALVLLGAQPAQAGASIEIADPFARATLPQMKTGVVYLTIVNHGPVDDQLLAAASPVAASAELHATAMDANLMQMSALPGLALPVGKTVELKPGGVHIMLLGLKQPLEMGASFPIRLTFEKAPPIEVTVRIEKAGASGAHTGHGMKM
jgi:copper(I)-binding protein